MTKFKSINDNRTIKTYKKMTFTYDIHFNSEDHSNNKGFKLTYNEAEKYIKMYNGTNHSYFADYKSGEVSIVCNETGESMKEVKIV